MGHQNAAKPATAADGAPASSVERLGGELVISNTPAPGLRQHVLLAVVADLNDLTIADVDKLVLRLSQDLAGLSHLVAPSDHSSVVTAKCVEVG